MLKFLSQPLTMILDIVDVMTKDTLKIDAVRIGFLVLYLGVIIGLCFLFLYWGVPIVSDVFSVVGKGVAT